MKIQSFSFLLLLAIATTSYAQQENEQESIESGYGNNIISLTPFAYNNEAFSYGFFYERFLTENGKLSLYIPVVYNFRPSEYHYRDMYSEKNLGIYIGFKYYTAGSNAPVKYALGGLMGKLTSYRHTTATLFPGQGGGSVEKDERLTQSLTGFMFHNSLNVFFAKKFCYSMELNIGFAAQSGYDDAEVLPFGLFQMSLGYRF